MIIFLILIRYWQKLEEKGFDPSIEYNKAIEGFTMHYHPKSEQTFKIIIQVSRFLKEFSDFETILTPKYRHPPIMFKLSYKFRFYNILINLEVLLIQ